MESFTGYWSGYKIRASNNDRDYEITTAEGCRGIDIPVLISILNDGTWVITHNKYDLTIKDIRNISKSVQQEKDIEYKNLIIDAYQLLQISHPDLASWGKETQDSWEDDRVKWIKKAMQIIRE